MAWAAGRGFLAAVVAAALGAGAACGPRPAPAPAAPASRPAAAALPRCASAADVERLHGQRVVVEGRYEVEPVPGGKRLQAVVIVLPDGTRLIRSYRPVPAEFGLVNRRVVAVGTVYRDSGEGAHVQAVGGPHFRPERVDLAPSESPYSPNVPAELPPPPVVANAREFDALADRWVQAWGTLVRVTPHQEDPLWANAVVKLTDGTEVSLRAVTRSRWERYVGEGVTVIGRAVPAVPGEAGRRLVDRSTVCPGHVKRCDLERTSR
jgi:hypothetical protein